METFSDIGLSIVNDCIDIDFEESGDLKNDNGLETAILISLFTDKRVTDDELPHGHSKKRGWWGDLFPDVDNDQIGSKLWTLDRSKQTPETERRFEELSRDALQWLIEDGVASSINISANFISRGHLILSIDIEQPSQIESRFSFVWDGQEIKRG